MNAHAMLGSVATAMLTFTAVAVAHNVINPVTLDIGSVTRESITIEPITIEHDPIERIKVSKPSIHIMVDNKDLECMATNMYFEARNQNTDEAMAAVGYIVLNRVAAKRYQNTVCGVVYEGKRRSGQYVRNKCQFSWVCDGTSNVVRPHNVIERDAWERSKRIAYGVLSRTIDNPIGSATMYHATHVSPYWMNAYDMVVQIEDHIFYQERI